MKPLPETIPHQGNPYHRLYVKDGIHHLYGYRRRYLRVSNSGMKCGEINADELLREILERIKINAQLESRQ